MTTPVSTATPDKVMKPTPAVMDSGIPVTSSANTPPVSARGTPGEYEKCLFDGTKGDEQQAEDEQQRERDYCGQPLDGRGQLLERAPVLNEITRRSRTSRSIFSLASATNPARSRPRTLAPMTMRRLPLSREI